MPNDAPVAARRRGGIRGRSLWWYGLLALLLASNLGLGIWWWLDGGRNEPASHVVRPQSAPVLHLLSERHGEASSASAEASAQALSASQALGPATSMSRSTVDGTSSSLAGIDLPNAGAAPASTLASADVDANASSKAVRPLAAGAPRQREISQRDPGIAIKQGSIRPQYACVALGPFNTPDDVHKASVAWRELGARQRIHREPSTLARRWWVYLPPQLSRAQAIAQVRQLHARGIDDYFVLGGGGQKSVVSLGLFKDPGNAYKRRDQIEQAGFAAQVAERGEAAEAYWLDVAVEDDGVHPGWREAIHNHGIVTHLKGRSVTAESCF